MLETDDQVSAIFADARTLYADALEMLEADKLRNAAEKAWGATKRATDALIIARTAEELRPGQTTHKLRTLRREANSDEAEMFESVRVRYFAWQNLLHGRCFYNGDCAPQSDIVADIRETLDYIRDAEVLAGKQSSICTIKNIHHPTDKKGETVYLPLMFSPYPLGCQESCTD